MTWTGPAPAVGALEPGWVRWAWPRLVAWSRLWATRPRFLVLAAFLFAGDLKNDPRLAWIPVDLTLATGAVLSGVMALRLARGARLGAPGGLLPVAAWYLTFTPGLLHVVDSPYAFQKVMTIFTFTLLSSLAPFFLLETREDLPRVINAMAFFCLLITLEGLLGHHQGSQEAQRLQSFGAGTISLGRATGLLFTYAALLTAMEAPLPGFSFAIMVLAGVTALFSGSRGPILASLAVLALLFSTGRLRLGRRLPRLLAASALFGVVLAGSLSLAPKGSLRRVEAFFRGQYGASERYRLQALDATWNLVGEAPWGIGWGGFSTHVDPERGLPRQYPHNMLAEVTLESGWACGAMTLMVLGMALVVAWSETHRTSGRVAFAGVGFYVVNAMISGDVNDNRPLFMFVSSALWLWQARR